MSITLECIAVDDEPLALGLVCAFIEKTPFLNLAGRYSSAVEALQVINSKPIDVIFLDIQMPDLTGIELIDLDPDTGPVSEEAQAEVVGGLLLYDGTPEDFVQALEPGSLGEADGVSETNGNDEVVRQPE